MTVQAALRQGCELLEEGAIPAPRLQAEVLLCHALGCERSHLYGHPEEELSEIAWLDYGRYLHQRLQGKPTQYITRRQEFYGRDFLVTPDVLIPRPETEHVVFTAMNLARNSKTVVDVGCGSGAIAVTLRLEMEAEVWGTDISHAALAVAQENARRHEVAVHLVTCELASAIAGRSADLLVSNPPYVPLADRASLQREVRDYEPPVALYAGPTGFEIYQRLVLDAERVLRPGGWMVVEIGFRAENPVRQLLGPGWQDVRVVPDLAGLPRVLAARLAP